MSANKHGHDEHEAKNRGGKKVPSDYQEPKVGSHGGNDNFLASRFSTFQCDDILPKILRGYFLRVVDYILSLCDS